MGEGNTAARVLYALHVTRNAMVQRTSQFRRRRTVHACIMATKKHPVTRQSALRFETLYRRSVQYDVGLPCQTRNYGRPQRIVTMSLSVCWANASPFCR
jgi:hypothetical protein